MCAEGATGLGGAPCWAISNPATKSRAELRNRFFTQLPAAVSILRADYHTRFNSSLTTRTAIKAAAPMLASYSRCFQ